MLTATSRAALVQLLTSPDTVLGMGSARRAPAMRLAARRAVVTSSKPLEVPGKSRRQATTRR
jgi:hypothetical protein